MVKTIMVCWLCGRAVMVNFDKDFVDKHLAFRAHVRTHAEQLPMKNLDGELVKGGWGWTDFQTWVSEPFEIGNELHRKILDFLKGKGVKKIVKAKTSIECALI